jgi:predicted Zn-dependent protease
LIWSHSAHSSDQIPLTNAYFDRLRAFVNRERYEQALASGNVEMGRWDVSLREYAEELLRDGKKQEALAVLQNVVTTSPTDYEAQIALATNTSDASAASNSARVVFDNAESPELISTSARLLQENDPASVQPPILDKQGSGLKVVLIPLAPCDIGLLARVSSVYSGITKIPVKVMRMAEAWRFGSPDRIPNQRQVQQFIAQRGGANPDFTGWTLDRYKTELLKVAASSDALTKFNVNSLMARPGTSSGQYSVDSYLEKFADIVAKYRSNDPRTLYVGITAVNISSDDANFMFSTTIRRPEGYVAILSYHMMLSKTLNEARESRTRLAERIAKELVPATLNQLGIPRPVDPADPFSYSGGVERLDQKTLVLSKPTEDALAKFR